MGHYCEPLNEVVDRSKVSCGECVLTDEFMEFVDEIQSFNDQQKQWLEIFSFSQRESVFSLLTSPTSDITQEDYTKLAQAIDQSNMSFSGVLSAHFQLSEMDLDEYTDTYIDDSFPDA